MFKSIIRGLFRFVSIIGIVAIVSLGVILKTSPKPPQSAFTHDEVAKINPVLIIHGGTLVDRGLFTESMSDMVSRLGLRGVLLPTPFGPAINPGVKDYALPIIIQSGGGYVSLGNELVNFMQALRESGIKLNCYVGEAQSMAFHIMTVMCDKVIAKRSARLMQHRTHCGKGCSTPTTYQTDIELSRKEAYALGVKYDEWHNLVRGPEDHVFNLLEIEKYKLVDEWMD